MREINLEVNEIIDQFCAKRLNQEVAGFEYDFNLQDLHFAEKLLVDDELVEYILNLQDILGPNPTKLGDKIALVLAPPDKKAKALAKTIRSLNLLEPSEY